MKPNDKDYKKYHALDVPNDIWNEMTEDERKECVERSLDYEIEMFEMIECGMWMRDRKYEVVRKIPLCHDFGVEP